MIIRISTLWGRKTQFELHLENKYICIQYIYIQPLSSNPAALRLYPVAAGPPPGLGHQKCDFGGVPMCCEEQWWI